MAKTTQPQAGDTYVFNGEVIGVDEGRITPGTSVTIREFVEAGTTGAHSSDEDAVVIEWDAPSLVHTDKGVEVGTVRRAMSIGTSQFDTDFAKE